MARAKRCGRSQVAAQPDPAAPFVPVADYNIIADPAEFAGALLKELARG